jgi:hypothetical protein
MSSSTDTLPPLGDGQHKGIPVTVFLIRNPPFTPGQNKPPPISWFDGMELPAVAWLLYEDPYRTAMDGYVLQEYLDGESYYDTIPSSEFWDIIRDMSVTGVTREDIAFQHEYWRNKIILDLSEPKPHPASEHEF